MLADERLDVLYDQAKTAYDGGRQPVALELLSAYVRLRPDHGYAWYMFGESLRVVGLLQEAERALLRALELAPIDSKWSVCARLGRLHDDAGNRSAAEQWYVQAMEADEAGNTAWVWIFRGANLASQCQLKAAEQCHRHAVALNDDLRDEAFLNLGLVLRAQGRYDEAASAFREAVAITPDYREAIEALQSVEGIEDAMRLARELR